MYPVSGLIFHVTVALTSEADFFLGPVSPGKIVYLSHYDFDL